MNETWTALALIGVIFVVFAWNVPPAGTEGWPGWKRDARRLWEDRPWKSREDER